MISSSIINYYFTQLIGNPNSLPTIKATASFTGLGLIDGDQYQSDGNQGWTSTGVFYQQIRNLILDMTAIPASSAATGIHWPTGQATSIQNVKIYMSQNSGTQHQGLFIENGKTLAGQNDPSSEDLVKLAQAREVLSQILQSLVAYMAPI